jgi:AAA domain, putative AbiEii toxin, Type IV TA system
MTIAPLTRRLAPCLLLSVNVRATPSLRIAKMVITNFRTFREPTEILLASKDVADEMPVFHGPNGAGKSNALAALDLFFRGASCWLSSGASPAVGTMSELKLPWGWADDRSGLSLSHRTWPPGIRDPQIVEVHFADTKLGALRFTLTPSGNEAILHMERVTMVPGKTSLDRRFSALEKTEAIWLKNTLETPLGPGSKPLFLLDARRRDFKSIGEGAAKKAAPASPLSPAMADRLFALATSLEPTETERWRAFVSLINRFKTLAGRELSVIQVPRAEGSSSTDLRFEIRGKQILQLSELSSGEQQVIAVCAAVLTSGAAIIAVEEPEMSLHPDNQGLVRDMLLEQVRSGVVDQIFLESHVPIFDGPEVIRFSRSSAGETLVARLPAGADDMVRARARSSGAEEQWVTPEGYTQLPREMLEDLGLQAGGYLWFLRSGPEDRWQTWKADELDRMGSREAADTGRRAKKGLRS